MRVPNTDFGLDLHSSSPDPVNFFGAQSSLGGAQFPFGGARPRNAPPPVAPVLYVYCQARSQDLEKGGGFFERVRKVETTLTRIFIALESESHGLFESSRKARKFKRFFRPKTGGLQIKKKKKRSSPILRLIFRPTSEILTKFHMFFTTSAPASWSSGNAFVSGARGLRFKSRAGQTGHSVANVSPPLQHFFERSCVAPAQ